MHEPLLFDDREQAGSLLAEHLIPYKNSNSAIVSISPGGVPIGYKMAEYLKLPFDIVVTVDIPAPEHPHAILASLASGDILTIDRSVQSALQIPDTILEQEINHHISILNQRMITYKSGKNINASSIETIFLIDDGTASNIGIRAAVESIKTCHNPQKIVFATPVCSQETIKFLNDVVDNVVCINHPRHLYTPSNWYKNFDPISETKLLSYLESR